MKKNKTFLSTIQNTSVTRKWQLKFLQEFVGREDIIQLLLVSGKVSKVIALIQNLKDSYNLDLHKMMMLRGMSWWELQWAALYLVV